MRAQHVCTEVLIQYYCGSFNVWKYHESRDYYQAFQWGVYRPDM